MFGSSEQLAPSRLREIITRYDNYDPGLARSDPLSLLLSKIPQKIKSKSKPAKGNSSVSFPPGPTSVLFSGLEKSKESIMKSVFSIEFIDQNKCSAFRYVKTFKKVYRRMDNAVQFARENLQKYGATYALVCAQLPCGKFPFYSPDTHVKVQVD
jgi:hypothetical protein